MGSQKSSTSTSYSGSGQRWARPIAEKAAGTVTGVYNQNAPHLAGVVGKTDNLADALGNKFGASSVQAGQARDYISQVLGGNFLGSNPNLQHVLDATNRDIRDNVGSQAELAGRYGSGAHQDLLTRGIGDNEAKIRYADYQNERNQMSGAAGLAAQMNGQDAAQALGAYGQSAEMPYVGTDHLANQLAALFNGGSSKSVQYSPNPIWGALGAGLGAAGAYFGAPSDRRLKKNIVQTGTRSDGLNTYQWVYKNDPTQTVCDGYMADEVKVIYPDAYIENFNGTGYAGVNYALIPHETKLAA